MHPTSEIDKTVPPSSADEGAWVGLDGALQAPNSSADRGSGLLAVEHELERRAAA